MDHVSVGLRPRAFIMFAQAVREREFSREGEKELATTTVRNALDQVASIFRSSRRSYPFKVGSHIDFKLDLMSQVNADNDPPEE